MTFNFGNFNNFYPYMSNSWGFGNNYSNTNTKNKNKKKIVIEGTIDNEK